MTCIEYLVGQRKYTCKPTYRVAKQRLKEVCKNSVYMYMCFMCICTCTHIHTQMEQKHHFLVKKRWGDKCRACHKTFSRNYGFSVGRDQEAVVCSWCKDAVSGL